MLRDQTVMGKSPRDETGGSPSGQSPDPEKRSASSSGLRAESYGLVVLFMMIIDCSGSVLTQRKKAQSFYNRLLENIGKDTIAATMVRHSLVTFSTGVQATPFTPILECKPAELEFGGATRFWEAHERAFSMIAEEKLALERAGRQVLRKLAISVSDMRATDQPGSTPSLVHSGERNHRVNLFPVVVGEDVDWEVANKLSCKRKAALLDESKIEEFFAWAGKSVIVASMSQPGEEFSVPAPDWVKCD